MVVDTSVVMAILQQEPNAQDFAAAIEAADLRLISAVSVLEAGILAQARKGDPGAQELDSFLAAADLKTIPFDEEQSIVARDAFKRFGKGRHPAGLHFCDCAVYALAATHAEPLLFHSDEFSATDIEACLPSGVSGTL